MEEDFKKKIRETYCNNETNEAWVDKLFELFTEKSKHRDEYEKELRKAFGLE